MKKLLLSLVAVVVLAGSADAAPVFSCGDTVAVCNGSTYAVTADQYVAGQWYYSLWIKTDATTYTGDSTDFINAVALSELLGSFTGTNAALVQAPGGVGNWTFNANELNANGCAGGGTNSLCAQATYPSSGVAVLPGGAGATYQWQFRFDAPATADLTAHIKYLYIDNALLLDNKGKPDYNRSKVGDLGSWDIAVQPCASTAPGCSSDNSTVPEPGSIFMIGLGLSGIIARARRRA